MRAKGVTLNNVGSDQAERVARILRAANASGVPSRPAFALRTVERRQFPVQTSTMDF